MPEVVLIVDDEESVRRTMRDWLAALPEPITVLVASDAEQALVLASEYPVDLAVLDWNLGSGTDGLQLLEDLAEFRPDIVAILVTGFANQATPLDALRMGVRDYLDKNQDFGRKTFTAAVLRQLEKLRPAKRQRALTESLSAFRAAVAEVVPLVAATSALNDPVPLPHAVQTIFRFLLRATGAPDGVLIVRTLDAASGADSTAVYAPTGERLDAPAIAFGRTLAASVAGESGPVLLDGLDDSGLVEFYPFERGRASILAAPVRAGAGVTAVLELFDKPTFTDEDRRLLSAASEFGSDLLRQALAERQSQSLLARAIQSALAATAEVERALSGPGVVPDSIPSGAAAAALAGIESGVANDPNALAGGPATVALAEAIRALAARHGPAAVDHCLVLVRDLKRLLDRLTDAG